MKGYFAKYIPVVFLFTLVFIFINAIISFYNLQTLLLNNRLTNHSEEVILKLTSVHLSMKDVEINHRNFLVTNDPSYLSQYTSSITQTKSEITKLKQLIGDNPDQEKKVILLEKLITNRVTLLQNRINIFKEGGLSPVIEASKSGEGVQLAQELTKTFSDLEANETTLLNMRSAQSKGSANRTYVTILIATLFNILLIFISYYLIKRELEYRSTMEKRKDEFISIATHELKTPITSLLVFAQILHKKLSQKGDSEVKQYSQRITAQTLRLNELVSDLLDVSRLQLGKLKFEKTNFDLNKLLREIITGLQGTTDKHKILIKGKITKPVYGDEDRIGQVITNLVSNAIKYSPEGKKISITLKQELNSAVVHVQDYGIGISKEHKDHVFERFYRAYGESEKNFPGLGMGLYISQEIIRRHRGRLWFISTEGKGSTFSFSIPFAKKAYLKTQKSVV